MPRSTRHRTTRHSGPQTTPRHVWLAALGLAAVARREAATAASIAREELPRLGGQALRLAGDARDVARGIALTVQERVGPELGRVGDALQARIDALYRSVAARPAASRTRRAPARRASGRNAAGRKQAESRIARKGR